MTVKTRARLGALGALLVISGCMSEAGEIGDDPGELLGEEVEVASEPLLGSIHIDDCSDEDTALITDAIRLGRAVASTPEYAECLRTAGYVPYDGDPAQGIEGALRVSLSANDVDIECEDLSDDALGSTSWWDQHDFEHSRDETFSLDTGYLAQQRAQPTRALAAAQVAGTIWHEVMHTHGYEHENGCSNTDPRCWNGRRVTAPYIVGICMREMIAGIAGNLAEDLASRYFRRYRPAVVSDADRATIHAQMMSGNWAAGELETFAVGATRRDVATLAMDGATLSGLAAASGDVDGGGGGDVVLVSVDANASGRDYLRLKLGRNCAFGDCLWSPVQTVVMDAEVAGSPMVALYDFDGDGRQEVVVGLVDVWDAGNDYVRYRVGGCTTGTCSFGPLQSVQLDGAVLAGGSLAVADLDGSGRPELIVSAIDRWSGNDYWRYRISADCDAAGNCSFGGSAVLSATTDGAEVIDGDLGVGDLDGDGRPEIVLGGIDRSSGVDYVRYRLGRACTRAGCTFSPVRTVQLGGDTLDSLSISVANLSTQVGLRGAAAEILVGAIDRWDAGDDYWRFRALGDCNAADGVCREGDLHGLLTHGRTVPGSAIIAANIGPIFPWSPEVLLVGMDSWDGGNVYLRFSSIELASSEQRSRYLFGTFRSDTGDQWWNLRDVGYPQVRYEAIETAGDRDFYRFRVDRRTDVDIRLQFSHAVGDIDLELARGDASETLARSTGVTDEERITTTLEPGTYLVRVYGYGGARGGYTLSMRDPIVFVPRLPF